MKQEKEDIVKIEGVVKEALPNFRYRVEVEGGHIVLAYASGKMQMHSIKILPGDTVDMELSTYDLSRGRIVRRHKK
jgi:translation initiation factor IF-1